MCYGAKCFILFHHKRYLADMGAPDIRAFLTHLAVDGQVAASTHNVALQALIFLQHHVLKTAFAAEAKQCWPRVGVVPRSGAEVEDAFQSAIAAVQTAQED